MNNDRLYKVLGVSPDVGDEELKARYNELVKQYQKDRFLEGEAGNYAAKRLTEVESAYAEIISLRSQAQSGGNHGELLSEIEKNIRDGKLQEAQIKLDTFDERSAEWHYLQAVVYYKKNWMNESKKQLEIAIRLDSAENKYKDALKKLNDKITAAPAQDTFKSGSGNSSTIDYDEPQQMGGDSCLEFCCQMLACNMCLNCCCNLR